MTPTRMRLAAAEARKLASEIVEGTAPEMDATTYCGCACAVIVSRVPGMISNNTFYDARNLDTIAIDDARPAWGVGLISNGLYYHGPEGAVFPLLALADALEDRANEAEAP